MAHVIWVPAITDLDCILDSVSQLGPALAVKGVQQINQQISDSSVILALKQIN